MARTSSNAHETVSSPSKKDVITRVVKALKECGVNVDDDNTIPVGDATASLEEDDDSFDVERHINDLCTFYSQNSKGNLYDIIAHQFEAVDHLSTNLSRLEATDAIRISTRVSEKLEPLVTAYVYPCVLACASPVKAVSTILEKVKELGLKQSLSNKTYVPVASNKDGWGTLFLHSATSSKNFFSLFATYPPSDVDPNQLEKLKQELNLKYSSKGKEDKYVTVVIKICEESLFVPNSCRKYLGSDGYYPARIQPPYTNSMNASTAAPAGVSTEALLDCRNDMIAAADLKLGDNDASLHDDDDNRAAWTNGG